ncbi:MAG: hypothetical protein AAB515_00565 [Patescibacteria group bacterium]
MRRKAVSTIILCILVLTTTACDRLISDVITATDSYTALIITVRRTTNGDVFPGVFTSTTRPNYSTYTNVDGVSEMPARNQAQNQTVHFEWRARLNGELRAQNYTFALTKGPRHVDWRLNDDPLNPNYKLGSPPVVQRDGAVKLGSTLYIPFGACETILVDTTIVEILVQRDLVTNSAN